jgi:hypothetical protein
MIYTNSLITRAPLATTSAGAIFHTTGAAKIDEVLSGITHNLFF